MTHTEHACACYSCTWVEQELLILARPYMRVGAGLETNAQRSYVPVPVPVPVNVSVPDAVDAGYDTAATVTAPDAEATAADPAAAGTDRLLHWNSEPTKEAVILPSFVFSNAKVPNAAPKGENPEGGADGTWTRFWRKMVPLTFMAVVVVT